MASEICQHCNHPISCDDDVSVRDGYSYHEECDKCFVCSETNLHKAEVLMGTILCYGCSQRIFQGCAAVKQGKRQGDRKERPSRKSYRVMDSSQDKYKHRVLGMAQYMWSSGSGRKMAESVQRKSKPIKYITNDSIDTNYSTLDYDNRASKRKSNEIGTSTDVTRYLLERMESSYCKMFDDCKTSANRTKKRSEMDDDKSKSNTHISQIRCAELGVSTEIANMALRKKSEMVVTIKSESQTKQLEPNNSSTLNETSGTSGHYLESDLSTIRDYLLGNQLGHVLKMPIKSFKRNIIDRSSAIDRVNLHSMHDRRSTNITKSVEPSKAIAHQKKGAKRLYSTINRNSSPYKLGWMDLKSKSFCCIKSGDCQVHPVRCKHYRRSHNYRCLREQAMRLAGPTKSQLACFRAKIFRTRI